MATSIPKIHSRYFPGRSEFVARYRQREWPRDRLDPDRSTGLLVVGMGGPDGPEAVEPFLRNLFADPAVLPLPPWLARLVGRIIVRRRAERVRERYATIGFGGGSPQLHWTQQQAEALAAGLEARGLRVHAACAMRYWHPFAEEALRDLLAGGCEQLLVLPAYPQYSSAMTGSILTTVTEAAARSAPHLPLHVVPNWHLLPGYIATLAGQASTELATWIAADHDPGTCALLYVAHSLPKRFIRGGDPYVDQTRATVAAAHQRLRREVGGLGEHGEHGAWLDRLPGGGTPLIAYQSKVGPVRWVGPTLVDEAQRLAAAGCRRLLVVPVSFTCEHIETIHELDIDLAELVQGLGVQDFRRTPALNLHPVWLESMVELLADQVNDTGSAGESR
jgi:ferrochelatase